MFLFHLDNKNVVKTIRATTRLGSPNHSFILVFLLIVFFGGSRGMPAGCVCVCAGQDGVHPHSHMGRNDALLHTLPCKPCSFCSHHNLVETLFHLWDSYSTEQHILNGCVSPVRGLSPMLWSTCWIMGSWWDLPSSSVPGRKTTGHVVNALPSLFHFWQRGYHLWFCGKPPPEDPDRKDSETGRQQFQRLENPPERNASGKNHNSLSHDARGWGPFWVPVHIWNLIWTSRSPVNQCRQVLSFNFVDEEIKAECVIFKSVQKHHFRTGVVIL